jgi:hypothetical protein
VVLVSTLVAFSNCQKIRTKTNRITKKDSLFLIQEARFHDFENSIDKINFPKVKYIWKQSQKNISIYNLTSNGPFNTLCLFIKDVTGSKQRFLYHYLMGNYGYCQKEGFKYQEVAKFNRMINKINYFKNLNYQDTTKINLLVDLFLITQVSSNDIPLAHGVNNMFPNAYFLNLRNVEIIKNDEEKVRFIKDTLNDSSLLELKLPTKKEYGREYKRNSEFENPYDNLDKTVTKYNDRILKIFNKNETINYKTTIENKKGLKKYFNKNQLSINYPKMFYVFTKPDLRFYKVILKISKNDEIWVNYEYINPEYEWSNMFY